MLSGFADTLIEILSVFLCTYRQMLMFDLEIRHNVSFQIGAYSKFMILFVSYV
jgi:hypothetical protein